MQCICLVVLNLPTARMFPTFDVCMKTIAYYEEKQLALCGTLNRKVTPLSHAQLTRVSETGFDPVSTWFAFTCTLFVHSKMT